MSTESTVPQGKKVYFEAGKAFCYDQGKRVYIEDPELVRQAQAAFKDESERRWFDVCVTCGSWREYRRTAHPFNEPNPEDHDAGFFTEFHGRNCSGNVEHSNAKEFQTLPDEKRWRSESCPDYVPFSTAWVRHNSELEIKLLGKWDNPGYSVRESFTFLEQGRGRYMNWVGVHPDDLEFAWQVRAGEFLVLCPKEASPAVSARLAPPGGIHFELVTYTAPYGQPKTNLRLEFPQHQHPFVYERAEPERRWPVEESERVENVPEVEAHRLRPEYVTALLRAGAEFKAGLRCQQASIKKRDRAEWAERAGGGSRSEDELLALIEADRDTTAWVMADRLFRVLWHLKLRSGIRLAALYPRNEDFGGRVVGVNAEWASVLERTTLRMVSSGLQADEPPENVPGWVHWSPSACVSTDGTPASRFELSLLRNWTTRLLGFHCFYADGIIVGQDAIFGAKRIGIPEALIVPGDLRPLVAVVNDHTRESPFLPSNPEGIHRTGRGPFTLIEWHSAHQLCNPCHPPHGVTSICRNREWYRGTQLLWTERELLTSDDSLW